MKIGMWGHLLPPLLPQDIIGWTYASDKGQRVEITSAITQGFLQQILKSPKAVLGR